MMQRAPRHCKVSPCNKVRPCNAQGETLECLECLAVKSIFCCYVAITLVCVVQ
jgi:hypothetical protein